MEEMLTKVIANIFLKEDDVLVTRFSLWMTCRHSYVPSELIPTLCGVPFGPNSPPPRRIEGRYFVRTFGPKPLMTNSRLQPLASQIRLGKYW